MRKMKAMKKWLTIVPLALMSITMAGTPAFENPVYAASASFSDVPAGHWAYGAVDQLAKAGFVDGYGDKTFRGDKTMSRYEFAILVAKAVDKFDSADEANKQLIDKLSAEFAAELNRLGARVAKVEAKTNTWIGGETRFRVVGNDPKIGNKLSGSDTFEFRQRIKFWGNINDNMSFFGRLATTGGNKFGNAEYSSGSEIALDQMTVTAKNTLGFDSIRVGRSALDFITTGLIGKPMNVDGILLTDSWDKLSFKGWTGNIKTNKWNPTAGSAGAYTDNEAYQFTTGQLGYKLSKNLSLYGGYYWADVPGTSTTGGLGTLNTNIGSFSSSQGWTSSVVYKMGKYTLLGDYVGSKLDGAANLPDNPKGWAVQLSNSQGPAAMYQAVGLVNPNKVGTDAWMVSYRSVDAGAIPSGAGGFDTTSVARPGESYNVFTHSTDNVKAWFLAYQNVVAKNVVLSLEYQDYKIKDRSLTSLTNDKLDKTYMMKFEFFY
ncbi:S-layer homology domain-containing protein [Sporomusa aerivorans]|uniref:S-layer homology domain-containing protein n=1 Tax=Sporomusa aerivorans TaxID=204936 RepID=UPI00352A1186